MSNLVPPSDSDARPVLIVALRGEAPVPAAELGKLLSQLAADYRRINRGRTLVVTDIKFGSVITELTDLAKNAADVLKAGKLLADFAKTVTELFKGVKAKDGTLLTRGQKVPGQRSVEALLEAAIASGHEVEFSQTFEGRQTELKVTPKEAIRIREENRVRIAELEAAYRLADRPSPARLPPPPNDAALTLKQERDQLRALINADWNPKIMPSPPRALAPLEREHLRRLLAAPQGGEKDAEALLQKLAAALHGAGMARLLGVLADDLAAEGLVALAERVRSLQVLPH